MTTQTAETTTDTMRALLRKISALPNNSLKKLADYVEELIEDEEEAEDIAYIDALTPEDYANAIPFEDVVRKFEAEHGPLYKD